VSVEPRLDLDRPRSASALFGDALSLYARRFRTFLAIALAVVLPVDLIVSGLGLEELSSDFDRERNAAEQLIPVAVAFLVTTPLITAMTLNVVLDAARGVRPAAWPAIQRGLEVFAPIFFAVVLAGAGVLLGFAAFIVPGLYLLVRWYFVPQSVIVDGSRGPGALRASWDVVRGSWWRTFGIALLATLAGTLVGALLALPLVAAASSSDSGALGLAGTMLGETIAAPFISLVGTLLFFDLRARRAP
jgi:hypothetical protein